MAIQDQGYNEFTACFRRIFFHTLFVDARRSTIKDHYHATSHAIFSGVLSMWFTLWKSPVELIMHGVLMGICIEGINFYQLQEFYLFLTNTSPQMTFKSAFSINLVYIIISLVMNIYSCLF